MSKTCIITVTNGDFDYIDEWITYHHSIGVDLFLIGYNGDSNRFKELPQYDYVKYYDFSVNDNSINDIFADSRYVNEKYIDFVYVQKCIFNSLLYILNIFYTNIITYTAIIDTDEFLTIKDNNYLNINDFLDAYFLPDEVVMQVDMGIYGDNDLIYNDNRPCLERFTELKLHHNHNSDYVKWYRKSIFKNNDTRFKTLSMINAHISNYSINNIKFDFDKLELKHLWTKSLEEWISKFSKYNSKYNAHYMNRFACKMFYEYFIYNKLTDEKIKAIPELIKKYNVVVNFSDELYNPGNCEDDEQFRNKYKELNG